MPRLSMSAVPVLLALLLPSARAQASVSATGAPAAAASAPVASAAQHPSRDPEVQRILRAMGNSSTRGHPDLFGRFTGMRCFADHDYACALKYFKFGAYYADKFSQMAIGLMYANGNGVARNPVTAWAWLALAASRGYPGFVATRERIGRQLTPAQRAQAQAKLSTLDKTYADKVAEPRMLADMRLALMNMTGSHTGYDGGVITIPGPDYTEGAPTLTPFGFGNPLRDKWYWTPGKEYFAQRDAQWGGAGTVTVGPLQQAASAPAAAGSSAR